MSAADFLDQWFETDVLKATMSASGIIGTFLGVRSPGTAYVLLHHYMGEIDGVFRAWGFAKGGNGSVSGAIAGAARAAGAADGYLVALGDMPFVRPSTIAAVREALAVGALLAAPYWRARRGHPVGFAGSLRAELEALAGDEGAKRVLAAHEARLVKVPVGDPGAIRDIDRPSDLAPPLAV